MPDVPTFKELGYDLVASTWFSLAGPKGLPDAVTQRLNQEIIRIMELPDVKKKLAQDAFDPTPMTPAQAFGFHGIGNRALAADRARDAGMKK